MPRFDVTIAGELHLDLILYGLPDELPPERELLGSRMTLTIGGVDVSRMRRIPGAVKTGFTVVLQPEAWRNMVTYSGTTAELCWDDLDFDYLADARHFHLSSYYLQRALRPRVGELFQRLKSAGLTISRTPMTIPTTSGRGRLQEVLGYVDVFRPNEREARKVTGADDLEGAITKLSGMAAARG